MNLTGNAGSRAGHGMGGADASITPQEEFVTRVYASLDEAIACALDRLRRRDGIIPSCTRGCSYCCRNHIVMNVAEAHTLARYITREFPIGRIRGLRARTKRWHEWNAYRPGGHPLADRRAQAEYSAYDHCCPMLEDDACGAYPVRPAVCRTHYVRSDPRFCRGANDPESALPPPVTITSIIQETERFPAAMREYIEREGGDFSRSLMLLPHWLAIQMGWDFAVAP